VVKIFGLGIADDHAYIEMEYLSGGTLRSAVPVRSSAHRTI
jgi:hypothetical protein